LNSAKQNNIKYAKIKDKNINVIKKLINRTLCKFTQVILSKTFLRTFQVLWNKTNSAYFMLWSNSCMIYVVFHKDPFSVPCLFSTTLFPSFYSSFISHGSWVHVYADELQANPYCFHQDQLFQDCSHMLSYLLPPELPDAKLSLPAMNSPPTTHFFKNV